MSGRLAGKVAIVAGAGASGAVIGNGQATAMVFAREGAKVVCADAVEERAQATVDMIAREGGSASAIRADVSKAADCKAMVQAAVERYGRLDILDNNVGISGRAGIRVNCILPGLIYGPMTAPRMDEEIRRKRREAGALGTEGTGWDVAHAALFLASDESRWITGVALPVDAGFLVMSPTTTVRLAQQKF